MKLFFISQNNLAKKLGAFFKKRREELGLHQKDVAKILGYSSPQFISNMERGLSLPPIKKIKKLIKLYNLPPEEVLDLILNEQQKVLHQAIVGTK